MRISSLTQIILSAAALLAVALLAGCTVPDGQSTPGGSIFEGGNLAGAAGGQETMVAVDRFAFTFEAGRVKGDQSASLQVKAVYPNSVKTADVPISITEAIPEPVFTLKAPPQWDGR